MKYHEVNPITRLEAEQALSTCNADAICDALIRICYHDPDWRWVQDKCIEFTKHKNASVRGLAVVCLGHLARIHHTLDLELVIPLLDSLKDDPEIGGRVQNAIEDIEMFIET